MNEIELIDIYEVAQKFELSLNAIRNYKGLGLIVPSRKFGMKDLYNKADILRRRDLIQSLQNEGKSLREIAQYIKERSKGPNFEDLPAAKRKILIIEDDVSIASLIQEFFEQYFPAGSFQIHHEQNGPCGIESAIAHKPDLLILDIGLGRTMSGLEVLEQLENDPRIPHLEIIVISGIYLPQEEDKIKHFFGKPVNFVEMMKEVAKLTGIKSPKFGNK